MALSFGSPALTSSVPWLPCGRSGSDVLYIGPESGGGGIRTLGTVARTTVFETARFNHSRTPPRAVEKGSGSRRNLLRMDDATLERFADLAVGFGANVQQDQIVAIGCEPGKEYLVRALAASAYRHGAKFVDVGWFDPARQARAGRARASGHARLRPAVVRRARARARRPARRRASRCRGRARPACWRTSIPRWSARTGCRRSRRASRSSTTARRTGRSAPARRRPGPTSSSPSSTNGERLERLERELLHVLRLDEDDPIAAWTARADALVSTAERLSERRFDALHYEGPGTDLTIGLLPVVGLARRALPDRRRHRAHAQPPDRGGLHDARPRAHRGQRDLDQAARADRRHGRARPRRALRGRPRQPGSTHPRAARRWRRSSRPTTAPRGWARSRWSTARAASASWGRSSTTRCSTRTRRATSRSARASRSCSTRTTATAPTSREIHIDFMIGSNELTVTGITATGERVPVLVEGRWQI